jgi:microcystin degradation protein MlrC
VDAEVEVIGLKHDAWQSFDRSQVSLGDSAAIRIGGVEIVLISNRTQALGREVFTNLGVDPTSKRVVVVKSANHFRAAFGPIAGQIIYADGKGNVPIDCRAHRFERVARPLFPLDPRSEGSFVI